MTQRHNLFRNIVVFCTLFSLFFLFYFPQLRTYYLSGDDLFLLAGVPKNMSEFLGAFVNFSGQYRPLSHLSFYFFQLFLPNSTIIFTLNLFLLTAISFVFYLNLARLTSQIWAMILAVTIMLSPIFWYHFFALGSLNNSLMMLWGLLMLLMVDFGSDVLKPDIRRVIFTAILLVLSVMTKETFLVNWLIFVIVAWQNLPRKKSLIAIFISGGFVATFIALHFLLYKEINPDYKFIFTMQKFMENSGLIFTWLIGYPRGWQYAAPLPKNIWMYGQAALSLCVFSGTLLFGFFKKKFNVLFVVALILSLAPFFFLNRILVFYMDYAMLISVLFIVYVNRGFSQIFRDVLKFLLVLSFLWQFGLFYQQWHQYSFVANANETMHNYLEVIGKENIAQKSGICIINHTAGNWATMDGQAVNYLTSMHVKIISIPDANLPQECLHGNYFILKNDARKYLVVDDAASPH